MGQKMKTIKYVSLMLIVFFLIIGCSGTYGDFKTQSESESKITKRELIDNWSDYDIWIGSGTEYKPDEVRVIIFDPKNDDKKILAGVYYHKVKDQQMWTEIVNENTTSGGEFVLNLGNIGYNLSGEVTEIWGPENQLYGFILYAERYVRLEQVEVVDENTVRLPWHYPRGWGSW